MNKIQIVYRKTDELIPYIRNPRKNDPAVEPVANSIKEFGFKVPIILDSNGVIIAGHTRLKAAKMLGMEEVPTVMADDLSDEQAKAFRLADNKVGELAVWDMEQLIKEIDGIKDIDMSDFGFEFDTVITGVDDVLHEEKPEVEFSEALGEESNYIVLKFDQDIDWLNAKTLFGIKSVQCCSSRKDGKLNEGTNRIGIGRVLDGVEAIERLREEFS